MINKLWKCCNSYLFISISNPVWWIYESSQWYQVGLQGCRICTSLMVVNGSCLPTYQSRHGSCLPCSGGPLPHSPQERRHCMQLATGQASAPMIDAFAFPVTWLPTHQRPKSLLSKKFTSKGFRAFPSIYIEVWWTEPSPTRDKRGGTPACRRKGLPRPITYIP